MRKLDTIARELADAVRACEETVHGGGPAWHTACDRRIALEKEIVAVQGHVGMTASAPARSRFLPSDRRKTAGQRQGFIISERGLKRPATFRVEPGVVYGFGASSSPDLVYVTSVTDNLIRYIRYPFHGKEQVIERWIGEDLLAKGTRTKVADENRRLSMGWPETAWAASFRSSIAGGPGVKIRVKDYEPVTVTVVAVDQLRAKGRDNDPWYWAEEYGGVAGLKVEGQEGYEINSNRAELEKLQNDPRFRIVKTRFGKKEGG